MIGYELKQCFVKRENLLLAAAGLLVCFLYVGLKKPAVQINRYIEDDREFYMQELSLYGGAYDEAKDEALRLEEKAAGEEDKRFGAMLTREFFGEIGIEEVARETENLKYSRKNLTTLNYLRRQTDYVKKSPAERRIIYQNGWIELFYGSSLFFPALLWTVLLSATIFAGDYETGMYDLARSFVKGRRRKYFAKFFACLTVGCAFYIPSGIFRIVKLIVDFGLNDFNVSLNSVSAFSICFYSFSLIGTALVLCALRILGIVFAAALTALLSVMLKNSVKAAVGFAAFFALVGALPRSVFYYLGFGIISPADYIVGAGYGANRLYFLPAGLTVACIFAVLFSFLFVLCGSLMYEEGV